MLYDNLEIDASQSEETFGFNFLYMLRPSLSCSLSWNFFRSSSKSASLSWFSSSLLAPPAALSPHSALLSSVVCNWLFASSAFFFFFFLFFLFFFFFLSWASVPTAAEFYYDNVGKSMLSQCEYYLDDSFSNSLLIALESKKAHC